jgi:hypothetical protein
MIYAPLSINFEVQHALGTTESRIRGSVADLPTNQPRYGVLPNAADAESALPAESSRNTSATTPLRALFPAMRLSSASA